jgi:hypothetical protein
MWPIYRMPTAADRVVLRVSLVEVEDGFPAGMR